MNSLFYYLGIQILFSLAFAQRTPTISHITQEQIRDIGGVVELECSVQYAQDYPILWIKISPGRQIDPLPISTASTLIIRDSRFSVRYDPASSTYTLQIKDIQETDAGIYQCQVIISVNNKVSAEVDLLVRRPPIISDNSTRSRIVSEGQTVVLECYAGGFPKPRISWRRENNAILPTGGSIFRGNTLKINSVRKEDRGTYYCVAENGVGKGTRRNVAVEVEFSPVIVVPRPMQGQALQYDMDLECHVEAYPPPAIVWLKDGIQLANNQHYSISHFASADEYTDTTLRVITIEKRQYGTYTCKASNKLGSAEAQVKLFEVKKMISSSRSGCGEDEVYTPKSEVPEGYNESEDIQEAPKTKQNELLSLACEYLKETEGSENTTDKFYWLAKVWANKLRELERTQILLAERAINDILFQASLNSLQMPSPYCGTSTSNCNMLSLESSSNSTIHEQTEETAA